MVSKQEKYDRIAPKYNLWMAIPEFFFLRTLRRDLIASASGEILEVAAGTGRNFFYYQPAARVTAIDSSPDMLEIARRQAKKDWKSIRLMVMDAAVMDFPAQSFDTVISSLALCTFPHPVAAIREMSRVCRKDGRIFLLEHGRSTWEAIGKWQDRFAPRFARHTDCHMNRQPLDLVIQAGLEIVNYHSHYWGIVVVIEAKPVQ